ncbi:AAA family ATPase [Wolbachia pipientis]|uniref:AAA family ATPase n=1 Tax=Wolbachia pipientis TaxID=955 RepID=UPI0025A31F22|nr:AAA family ATPase [Wolbachia pipientis]MDM8334869.1 AAA family ATPase [Wolbachia pipientis]
MVDYTQLGEKVTLDDVIVSDQVRRELKMICGYISEKKEGSTQRARLQNTNRLCFIRSTENGKTLIVRAIAREANSKFINVSRFECIQKYVGHGAHYTKALFKKVRENAPCIVFID